MQLQVTSGFISKPGDCGRVKRNSVFKRARQLVRHNRDVLLLSEYIAKRKANKLDVLLLHILYNFFL